MNPVEPIDEARRHQVVARVSHYLALAERLFSRRFPVIPVSFDLRGRTAGMYRVKGRQRMIRFNPWLFAKYPEDSFASTIPHEVAHYVADLLYGLGRIRPHGREWRVIMNAFGAEPSVTCRYDLAGIPAGRQVQRFSYRCGCRSHQLSSYRHNRVRQGQTLYHCRACGGQLHYHP